MLSYSKRRSKLPEPIEKEKGVSLWSMIKDNVGKDLTRVCLPVYFNEPLSSLQKCFEELEYSYLLDRAYECGSRVCLFLLPSCFPRPKHFLLNENLTQTPKLNCLNLLKHCCWRNYPVVGNRRMKGKWLTQ